jgi:opacity protein-like surface antigen
MKTVRGTILVAMIAASFEASTLEAQITARPRIDIEQPSRFTIGGNLLVSQPKGELADNIDNGFGGDFFGMVRVDRPGVLSLRADVGGSQYGSETLPGGCIYACRIGVEVETTNSIFWGSIGPQVMVPTGRIRPYANAAVGFMNFETTSSVKGTGAYRGETYASSENQSDFTHAWIFGGGILFPFTGRMSMMSIDVGAKYFTGGRGSYLKEGAIQDNPDGSVTITPTYSKTDQVTWHVGVSYTIPRDVNH